MQNYLEISEVRSAKVDTTARPRLTVDGYTKLSGSPTHYKVRLASTGRWHRVYCVQFSNCPSFHIKTREGDRVISDGTLDDIETFAHEGIDTALVIDASFTTEAMIQEWRNR